MNEGVFPPPLYRIDTRRPFFTQEMQEICLEVRRRNCGINGRPVLFYARRLGAPMTKAKTTPPKNSHKHADLIEGLRALGLTTVNCLPGRGGDPAELSKWQVWDRRRDRFADGFPVI